ncbi:MAG TPA: SDR family oxidoreductase [Acidimicrobiales bacterium]|nr:SDR family oxidoreductase [Acidimicrobiales bacterium]
MTTVPPLPEHDPTPVPDFAARLRLDGRRFVVLGGGYGTGRQACHALSSLGATIVVVDIVEARARHVAEEVGGTAGIGDATVRDDMERLFAEAEVHLGGIDGVVDVIGLAEWGAIVDMPDEQWNAQHDITLRHVFLAVQIGGRAMAAGSGGTMVFVSSVSGLFSSANHAAYGAGKAGLLALVQSAAEELGPRGIRVNAVVPGSVATPRIEALRAAGVIAPWQDSPSPVGPPAETSDVAAAILFLSSPMSKNISGHALVIDGGQSVRTPFQTAKANVTTQVPPSGRDEPR